MFEVGVLIVVKMKRESAIMREERVRVNLRPR